MSTPSHGTQGPLCGANLQSTGQNRRLRAGALMLAVSLGLSVVLVRLELDRAWRLLLFFPFLVAAMGAWQGLYRTCPALVHGGKRENDDGEEGRVADPDQVKGARKLALRVMVGAMSSAMISTAVVLALP